MKTIRHISSILLMLFIGASCESSTNEQNEDNIDYTALDYINAIDVSMTHNGVMKLIPNDRKEISASDIGFVYSWERNSIIHDFSVFFYGYEHYSELRVLLDCSKNQTASEKIMIYLHKLIENKYGAPETYTNDDNEEFVEWKETRMEGEYFISLFYTKKEHLIAFETYILDVNDLEFENGTEGEWVQVGPEGEWVWMPH
jgi:hypothetical protein